MKLLVIISLLSSFVMPDIMGNILLLQDETVSLIQSYSEDRSDNESNESRDTNEDETLIDFYPCIFEDVLPLRMAFRTRPSMLCLQRSNSFKEIHSPPPEQGIV